MIKGAWLNLPVADIARTAKFYEALGFKKKSVSPDGRMVCFEVGERQWTVVFGVREQFEEWARCGVAETSDAAETMVSFDAESPEEVDEMARRVFEAGGSIFAPPAESQGWLYGFAFCDPDNHRWNMLHMDFAKMPK